MDKAAHGFDFFGGFAKEEVPLTCYFAHIGIGGSWFHGIRILYLEGRVKGYLGFVTTCGMFIAL